jgi:hypothetical protein
MSDSCGAPDQGADLPASIDTAKETVITGVIRTGGEPIGGGYVRLLDRNGDFVAEVATSSAGRFRFFAAPGPWTIRVLSRAGTATASVTANRGVNEVTVDV